MKRTLIMVLALVMVLAMVPTVALAAGTTHTVWDSAQLATALSNAADGDTIFLNNGNYNLGITQIDKNVTLIGQSEAGVVIKPTTNTGSVGDARGWILVKTGNSLKLKNLTINGTGKNIFIAVVANGDLVTENVTISDVKYSRYLGFGIGVYGSGSLNAKNLTMRNIERLGIHVKASTVIDGFTYTGKGVVDGIDYAMEIGTVTGGMTPFEVRVSNVTISNCVGVAATDGSGSAGIYINTYFYSSGGGTDPLINVIIDRANISNCSIGVYIGYRDTLGDYSNTTVSNSNFFGNEYDFVFWAKAPSGTLTTSNNYYGGGAPKVELATGLSISGMDSYSDSPIPINQDTVVTAGVEPTYTIVIPAAVNFGTLQKDTGLRTQDFPVSAQNVLIENGKAIVVSVNSNFKMAGGGALLDYLLKKFGGGVMTTGGEFARFFEDGESIGSVEVDTDDIVKAGSYQGTMTFTIAYQ